MSGNNNENNNENNSFEEFLKSLESDSNSSDNANSNEFNNTIEEQSSELRSKREEIIPNNDNSVFKDADHSEEYSTYLLSKIHPNMGFKEDKEDIEKAENEYIDAFLDYEAEIKELKQKFKNIMTDFSARGVNVRVINKTIKQIANESKKLTKVIKEETRIAERLCNDKKIVAKICAVLN